MKFYKTLGILLSLSFIFVSQAQIVEKIMAVVDDQMISLSQMNSYKKLLSSKTPYSSKLFSIRKKNRLIKSRKQLLNHLIDQNVLKSSIPLEQLNLPSREVLLNQTLKESRLSYKNLTQRLKKINLSLEDYKELIYFSKAYDTWIDMEISSSIQITNQDINDYYLAKHGKPLFTKYKYEIFQWKFELSQKGKEEARVFLKKSNKKDPEVKTLTDVEMNKELKKTISSLAIGQFSPVTCFARNCYVFKLINKTFFVEATKTVADIQNKLFQQNFLAKLKSWLEEKRTSAVIKRYL